MNYKNHRAYTIKSLIQVTGDGLVEVGGLEFKTSPAALIPRPETEELIFLVDKSNVVKESEANVLDIGTGTGIIPISLKSRNKNWNIFGLDISLNALKLAKENATKNNVEIEFIHTSIFDYSPTLKFDIIITSNR
mgnify:CR=1 FL=1